MEGIVMDILNKPSPNVQDNIQVYYSLEMKGFSRFEVDFDWSKE